MASALLLPEMGIRSYSLRHIRLHLDCPRLALVSPVRVSQVSSRNDTISREKTSCLYLRACTQNEPSWSTSNKKNQVIANATYILTKKLLNGIKLALHVVTTNFLPLGLISGVLFGLSCPELGQQAYQCGLSKWSTFGIFLLSGLALRTGELGKAVETWPALLFGLVSTLFFTPLVAALVLNVHLVPEELVTGLAVFCCVPTTLSSGVALTKLAGANTALALALTVLSNLLGILTMPVMIPKLVARGLGVTIPAEFLTRSLVETLLVPLLVGKVLRDYVPGIQDFVEKRGKLCSMLSSMCLLLVPWMQVSCSRDLLLHLKALNLVGAVSLGVFIHLVFLAWNTVGMLVIHYYFKTRDNCRTSAARAVILTASQKTLPVTVAVVGRLGGMLGEAGLLVLPCVAAHITQSSNGFWEKEVGWRKIEPSN